MEHLRRTGRAVRSCGADGRRSTHIKSSGDMRIRGTLDSTDGILSQRSSCSRGDTELSARQLYPTTLTVRESQGAQRRHLTLSSSGSGTPGTVLSAGGELHLNADKVNISTRVRAPFGLIDIVAKELDIRRVAACCRRARAPRSRSAVCRAVSRGCTTLATSTRVFASSDKVALPQQSITLSADKVSLESSGGAIDFSGGGDLLAAEFQPGPGGTKDHSLGGYFAGPVRHRAGLDLDYGAYDPREYRGLGVAAGRSYPSRHGAGRAAGRRLRVAAGASRAPRPKPSSAAY